MSTKKVSLLRQLLDEKIHQDLGKVIQQHARLSTRMRMALIDYVNAYHYLYYSSTPDTILTLIKERVQESKKYWQTPIIKTGTDLDKFKLSANENAYFNQILTIVDAANVYLNAKEYDIETLFLLKKVLDAYCYGKC